MIFVFGSTADYQFGFWLLMGVFITFLVPVLWYRWAQGRSASEQLPLKKFKGESFRYSFFLVALGFGQRYWFAVSGGLLIDPDKRIANIEWATNTQNAMCFTAVVCALNVLYNQQNRRGDAA
jgi:hypothetical protein